jgi:hypothetical protein
MKGMENEKVGNSSNSIGTGVTGGCAPQAQIRYSVSFPTFPFSILFIHTKISENLGARSLQIAPYRYARYGSRTPRV